MDAVGLAATIGGSVVGIAGVLSAWHSSAKERSFRFTDATAEREHARQLARDARVWADRRSAYHGLIVHLLNIMEGVEKAHPMIRIGPVGGGRQNQDDEAEAVTRVRTEEAAENLRLREIEASVIALGSAELVEIVQTFMKARLRFSLDVGHYEMVRGAGLGTQAGDAYTALNGTREELRTLFQSISALMRAELTQA